MEQTMERKDYLQEKVGGKGLLFCLIILSTIATFSLLFIPFFLVPTLRGGVMGLSLVSLVNLEGYSFGVNMVKEINLIEVIAVSIAVIAVVVMCFIAFVSLLSGSEKFYAKANRVDKSAKYITLMFFLVSVITLIYCNSTNASLVFSHNYFPYIACFIFSLIFNSKAKKITKKAGKNLFKGKPAWGVRMTVISLLTVVTEGVLVVVLSNDILPALTGFLIIVVLVTGITLLGISARKKAEEQDAQKYYIPPKEKEEAEKIAQADKGVFKKFYPEEAQTTKIYSFSSFIKEREFAEYDSLKKLTEDFKAFAKKSGVELRDGVAERIFASMAASRAIWVRSDSKEYAKTILKTVRAFFDGEGEIYNVKTGEQDERGVITTYVETNVGERALIEELYTMHEDDRAVGIVALTGAENTDFATAFRPFIEYFRAPLQDNEIYLGFVNGVSYATGIKNKVLDLTDNVWFWFILEDQNAKIPASSEEYSITLELGSAPVVPIENDEQNSPIAILNLLKLCDEALENHFLPLETWKKIDRVAENLAASSDFILTNHFIRQMENFSSVLMANGLDGIETVDNLLSCKILPYYANCKRTEARADKTVAECIDNLFGMENLPLTHKAITTYGLDK